MKRVIAVICALVMVLSMTACGKLEISKEIGTINDRSITKAEYMYYLETVKEQMLMEANPEDVEAFWEAEIDGEKASEAAKKKALEELLRIEIACIKAEEAGLSLSGADKSQIRGTVKTTNADQKMQIDAVQEATGLSDTQLINLLEKTTLASLYANHIDETNAELINPTDEEVKAAYESEYVHVKHILINSTNEATTTEGKTEEEVAAINEAYKAEQKAKADEALAKAKAGVNFDTLVKEYGQDPGMEQSPDGYTFTKGTMVPEFESASYALAVGQVSELVESSYGWHIIKKYALPTSGDDYDQAIEAVKSALSQEKFNVILDSFKSEMTIELNQKAIDGIKVK